MFSVRNRRNRNAAKIARCEVALVSGLFRGHFSAGSLRGSRLYLNFCRTADHFYEIRLTKRWEQLACCCLSWLDALPQWFFRRQRKQLTVENHAGEVGRPFGGYSRRSVTGLLHANFHEPQLAERDCERQAPEPARAWPPFLDESTSFTKRYGPVRDGRD